MTSRVQFNGRPVWAEISLGAIAKNLRAIRRHVGRNCKILAVVKANAYGHGAIPVAKALAKAGADWFGVTCVEEGAELRASGIRQPILILTGFWPGEERRLIEHGRNLCILDRHHFCPSGPHDPRGRAGKATNVNL